MTVPPAQPDRLTAAFPEPGHLVQLAYRDLETATVGSPDQIRLLGAIDSLPRPWNPATCADPRLQAQLGEWLHRVAGWVNRELCWQPADMLPGCWSMHPALVRGLALLADRRRTAELALTSDPVEEWHRHTLPAFLAQVRADAAGCVTGHRDWPGRTRQARQPL